MKYQFKTEKQLLALCQKHKASISRIAIEREMELFKKNQPQIRNKMKKVRDNMWQAIQKGIRVEGGDAKKVYKGTKRMVKVLESKVALRAMAYSLAIVDQNPGPFPKAGGTGIVPGVLFSTFEHMKSSKRRMLNALFTASVIALLMPKSKSQVSLETAMAAAGLTEMRGGKPEHCLKAAHHIMSNMASLKPKKNPALFIHLAIGASDLSLL